MGACRKKPAHACEWHSQLDDSIGNTLTTVSWRVWGYEVGLGWRLASSGISLPNNVFSWLLSDFTGPFSRPKNPSKTCAPHGASPVNSFCTVCMNIHIGKFVGQVQPRFVFVSCKHEPTQSVWQSPLANARYVAYNALATCRPDVVICTLVHTFSALYHD